MEAAAVALLIGHPDPLQFLATHPDDQQVILAVLNKAIRLDNEKRKNMLKSLIEGIGISTGNRVAEILSRMRF